MLERILERLESGGMHSVRTLARELNVTEPLVEAMLADLERMGYLKRVCASGCSGDCASCGLGASERTECNPACGIVGSGQLWTLARSNERPQQDVRAGRDSKNSKGPNP